MLYLQEYKRGIILNKTNAKVLVRIFGDDEKLGRARRLS